jgi:hypothetical protein
VKCKKRFTRNGLFNPVSDGLSDHQAVLKEIDKGEESIQAYYFDIAELQVDYAEWTEYGKGKEGDESKAPDEGRKIGYQPV